MTALGMAPGAHRRIGYVAALTWSLGANLTAVPVVHAARGHLPWPAVIALALTVGLLIAAPAMWLLHRGDRAARAAAARRAAAWAAFNAAYADFRAAFLSFTATLPDALDRTRP